MREKNFHQRIDTSNPLPSEHEPPLVIEVDERDLAIEAIDEARAHGFQPALVAFLDKGGNTRLFSIGVDHRPFLKHLVEAFSEISPEVEHGN